MPRVLTELGETFRSWMPVAFRESPDHLAVIHAVSKEIERLEDSIEQVRAQFFPSTADVLLKLWEWQLGITVAPVGLTIEQRRELVEAGMLKLKGTPSGSDWKLNVDAIIGSGAWTYEEHPAGSPYTVRVSLPAPPASGTFLRTVALLRDITPAHMALDVVFEGGFVLDTSGLDIQTLE